MLVELGAVSRLIPADPSRLDMRPRVVLRPDRGIRQPPQQAQLTRVRQRIRNRGLKYFLGLRHERRITREVRIERSQCGEETLAVRIPSGWRRGLPALVAARDPQSPVQQIGHVRENLSRSPAPWSRAQIGESGGRISEWLLRAVRERGQRVAEKIGSPRCRRGRHALATCFEE